MEHVFNPWGTNCEFDAEPNASRKRKQRLSSHLACPDPVLILIGEAPGFRACRYSGIPFTSEFQCFRV